MWGIGNVWGYFVVTTWTVKKTAPLCTGRLTDFCTHVLKWSSYCTISSLLLFHCQVISMFRAQVKHAKSMNKVPNKTGANKSRSGLQRNNCSSTPRNPNLPKVSNRARLHLNITWGHFLNLIRCLYFYTTRETFSHLYDTFKKTQIAAKADNQIMSIHSKKDFVKTYAFFIFIKPLFN